MTQLRPELQDFKDRFGGQEVFIIGGGPSLKNFDFNLLNSKITVSLNSSFERMSKWTAMFWADNDWASQNLDRITAIDSLKFTAKKFCDEHIRRNIKAMGGATVLRKGGDYGYSGDIDTVCGNNSGAMALNLVANTKPYRIILLGYDMQFIDGQSHHHKGYVVSSPSVYRDLFIPSINSMAPFIKKLGIEVVNCSPTSALECFNKESIDKYL